MEGNTEHAKAKRNALKDYCEERGLRFRESTHSLNRIVSCVFGVDRRRISAYSSALRKALNSKVEAQDLVSFIQDAGGIEEVRAQKSSSTLPTKSKAEIAGNTLYKSCLAKVANKKLAEYLDAANIGKHTLLVGTWNADGSVDVRAVINNASALNAALASCYNSLKEEREKEVIEVGFKEISQRKHEAIVSAAREATSLN